MSKQVVSTTNAPGAIGPYSQAISIGDMLFTSGQIPIDISTNTIPETIEDQTRVVFSNLKAVIEAAGFTMKDVVKTTVFIKDMNEFAAMNEVYKTFFEGDFPARSTVEVARLPRDVKVEIEAIASRRG